MKKNHFEMLFGIVFMAACMMSCENNLEIALPQGPKGDKGDPGKSAFELWLEHYEKEPTTSLEDFFNSLKGKDGAVPVIGENGNWYIDGVDTKLPSKGKNGANGVTPEIGGNGNWFIDGIDTKIPAQGINGNDGVNGKSAYELWKDAVDKEEMTNNDGTEYTKGNTWEDFLIWLQGGDTFVLFRYWKTIPGNEDKSMGDFIDELFDCFCSEGATPTLPSLEFDEPSLSIIDDNFLLLVMEGMSGMTVTAMDEKDHANSVILKESPEGVYSAGGIPRFSHSYTILIKMEKEGYQALTTTILVEGK